MKRLTDTSPEAERVLAEVFREMSPARKWKLLGEAQRMTRMLHEAGLRQLNPTATPSEIHHAWIAHRLGDLACHADRGYEMMDQPVEDLKVVHDVAGVFRSLGIGYALGGSLATTIYGAVRQTRDADMTAEPFPDKVESFVAEFGPDYYVSRTAIEQAIRDRSTFNLIHFPTGFKVDVFIKKDRPFDQEVMRRRSPFPVLEPPEQPIDIVTPEDILLLKLEWYRMGGESSDRQWSDILAVLRTRSDRLDFAYMEHWASTLKVDDLLTRARGESGFEGLGA